MKILVLGDSDTSGRQIGGEPWPELLRSDLQAGRGPVELVSVAFSPASPNAAAYCEKKVLEHKPDAVVLVIASFPFVAKFVWLRVEHLLGKRAGRWYKRIEDRFDSSTRGGGSVGKAANRTGRALVPRVLGRSSYASRAEVTKNYLETFRVLSRFEDTEVVLFGYPGISRAAGTTDATKQRKIFFAAVQAAAREHRFAWVDGIDLFTGHAREELMADDFHLNEFAHAMIANAVGARLKLQ